MDLGAAQLDHSRPAPRHISAWPRVRAQLSTYSGAGTFVIFAALYACGLPMLEGEWSLGRAGSLFLLTLMLGILMGGPLAAITGMTAAVTLFRFVRHFFAESGDRVPETGIV